MRILFLGDSLSNSKQWIQALKVNGDVEIIHWSINTKSKFIKTFKWLFFAIFGKIVFKKYKADLVIGYRTTSYGFLATRSGIKPCVIAAQGESDVWPKDGFAAVMKRMLKNYACLHSDLIHAWGEHMKPFILESGVDESRVFVCPRGIDIDLFQRTNVNFDLTKFVKFVSTRSLYPDYNYEIIIKALKIIHEKGYNFEYNIAGEGSSREDLKKLIEYCGLEGKVNLLGFVPNINLPNLLTNSHIYLSMPITEGVSASLFEAMASKCFPIVSNLPANKLFINEGINGNLVKIGDYLTLSKKIEFVISNELLYRQAIENNFELVNKIANLKNNMNSFVTQYKILINNYK
jgi:glycosyltransferase involved in cell wall biosynthesis